MKHFQVVQTGNRVELAGWEEPIFYEVSGVDLPPLTNYAFAVWHILPKALAEHFDFTIDGPVDAETLANATRMARTWELWQPRVFRAATVRATVTPPPPPPGRMSELTLYSAGIDSTHMLLSRGRLDRPGSALTIHGMDYSHETQRPFDELLEITGPLLTRLNYRRIFVRSNAIRLAHGFHGWGMLLAGHAFLLSGLFGSALFAADSTWEEDMAIFPWGSNHVTDRYFSGYDFHLRPQHDTVTRSEKVAAIAAVPDALRSVSFCKDRSVRPYNCGVCTKCVRTKVMFLLMTGAIPSIFHNNSYSERLLEVLPLNDRSETSFLVDVYQRARDSGRLELVPGLEQRMADIRQW